MKVNGNGQAAVIEPDKLKLLLTDGFDCQRDKVLFGICFYTACRISEALHLQRSDVLETHVIFRKAITKGKFKTREIPICPSLRLILADYQFKGEYLFCGRLVEKKTLSRNTADRNLRSACRKLGLKGVSTHSFRRTALTTMSTSGVPLRVIQKISGHSSLEQLQAYLEVSDQQLYNAALTLDF